MLSVKKLINPLFVSIIIIYLFFSLSLLLDDPLIWPDEAIYGDISRNIMLEGRMGTDLWKGFVDGIENHAYSLPPFFLYTGAIWFKIFGFSITTQRLFSVFLATVFIVIFYTLAQRLLPSKSKLTSRFLPLAATLMIVVDSVFLKTSRLSRPEILVLVLAAGAMLLFLRYFEEKTEGQKKQSSPANKFLFLTGLTLGLAVITHLIAVSFAAAFALTLIYTQRKNIFNLKKYYFFAAGILIPIIGWLISIYPNYQHLINQLELVSDSRNYTIPWYINVINLPLLMKLNYLLYLLITLIFILFTIKHRRQPYILLSIILISSWTFATLGEIYWYTVLALPFVYLALFILLSWRTKSSLAPLFKTVLIISCLFLLYSNLTNFLSLFNIYKGANNYHSFKNQITQNIPAGKTIYLSSIPDAYYAFEPGRNRLLEFPALFAGMDKFKKTIKEAEYMVFNGMYIPNPEASVYLDQYIAKNLDSVQELTSPYHVLIIKMKDESLRSDVN